MQKYYIYKGPEMCIVAVRAVRHIENYVYRQNAWKDFNIRLSRDHIHK